MEEALMVDGTRSSGERRARRSVFATVNLVRHLGKDPEQVLRAAKHQV